MRLEDWRRLQDKELASAVVLLSHKGNKKEENKTGKTDLNDRPKGEHNESEQTKTK